MRAPVPHNNNMIMWPDEEDDRGELAADWHEHGSLEDQRDQRWDKYLRQNDGPYVLEQTASEHSGRSGVSNPSINRSKRSDNHLALPVQPAARGGAKKQKASPHSMVLSESDSGNLSSSYLREDHSSHSKKESMNVDNRNPSHGGAGKGTFTPDQAMYKTETN